MDYTEVIEELKGRGYQVELKKRFCLITVGADKTSNQEAQQNYFLGYVSGDELAIDYAYKIWPKFNPIGCERYFPLLFVSGKFAVFCGYETFTQVLAEKFGGSCMGYAWLNEGKSNPQEIIALADKWYGE